MPASEVAAKSEGAHQPSQAIAAAGSCGSAPIFSWRPRILLCPPQAGPLTPAVLCSPQDPFPPGDPAAGTQPTGLPQPSNQPTGPPQPSDQPTGPPQPSDQLPCLVPGFSASRAQALPWVPKPECVPRRRPLSRVRWAALAAVLAVHCHIPASSVLCSLRELVPGRYQVCRGCGGHPEEHRGHAHPPLQRLLRPQSGKQERSGQSVRPSAFPDQIPERLPVYGIIPSPPTSLLKVSPDSQAPACTRPYMPSAWHSVLAQ